MTQSWCFVGILDNHSDVLCLHTVFVFQQLQTACQCANCANIWGCSCTLPGVRLVQMWFLNASLPERALLQNVCSVWTPTTPNSICCIPGWQSAGSHGVEAEAELRSDCQAAHMSASAGHEVDTTHCSSVSQIPSSKQPASASWLLSRPAAAAGQSSWWPFNLRQVRQSYA